MRAKKMFGLLAGVLVLTTLVLDVVRYATPGPDQKTLLQPAGSFPVKEGTNIIAVYNAYGGIFPGLADLVHKIAWPETYPCNLCKQAFGNFGVKPGWKTFLDSLPFEKMALHKENFKKRYQPADLQLPAILLRSEKGTELLVSAAEINETSSLAGLIALVQSKLKP